MQKGLFSLHPPGAEGQPSLPQFVIHQLRVGGRVLNEQNVQLFFHSKLRELVVSAPNGSAPGPPAVVGKKPETRWEKLRIQAHDFRHAFKHLPTTSSAR